MFKMLCFINLGEISVLTLFTTVRALKPVQQYGRLETVTMEMEKLYLLALYMFHWFMHGLLGWHIRQSLTLFGPTEFLRKSRHDDLNLYFLLQSHVPCDERPYQIWSISKPCNEQPYQMWSCQ